MDKLTVSQQLEQDLRIYGISMEHLKEDGTTERLDPTTVKIKRIVDDTFYPTPLVKPENYPAKRIELIVTPDEDLRKMFP